MLRMKLKTHCRNGHLMGPLSFWMRGTTKVCKACHRARVKKWRSKPDVALREAARTKAAAQAENAQMRTGKRRLRYQNDSYERARILEANREWRRRHFVSKRPTDEERCLALIEKVEGHWLWKGALNVVGGRTYPRFKGKSAARYVWKLVDPNLGPKSELHRMCDQECCVRPRCYEAVPRNLAVLTAVYATTAEAHKKAWETRRKRATC